MKSEIKISNFEYFIVSLFVICCGFTSADIIPAKSYVLGALGVNYLLRKRNKQPLKPLFILIFAYIIIGFLHYKVYGVLSRRTLWDIPLLTFSGFYVVDSLGEKFKYAYLNVMYYISIISLVFFILMFVINYIPNFSFLNSRPKLYQGIFIYNIRAGEIILGRNCGPFWEPGAYAGYLCLIFVLLFDKIGVIVKEQRKKIIIILITILSTFSSQGYVTLALIIFFYILRDKIGIKTIAVFFAFLAFSYVAYIEMPFLRDKINEQLELTEDWEDGNSLKSANRFTTAILDIYYIKKAPFIGNTDKPEIRYSDHPFILSVFAKSGGYGSGSGTTSSIAIYGFPLFIIWLYFLGRSLRRNYNSKESLFLICVILTLGFGEVYFAYIFYMSLPFIIYKPLTCKKNEANT